MFDVMWRFHIMDVTGDDKIDTWWMKLAAFLGLTVILRGLISRSIEHEKVASSVNQPQARFSDAGILDWTLCSIPTVSETM